MAGCFEGNDGAPEDAVVGEDHYPGSFGKAAWPGTDGAMPRRPFSFSLPNIAQCVEMSDDCPDRFFPLSDQDCPDRTGVWSVRIQSPGGRVSRRQNERFGQYNQLVSESGAAVIEYRAHI